MCGPVFSVPAHGCRRLLLRGSPAWPGSSRGNGVPSTEGPGAPPTRALGQAGHGTRWAPWPWRSGPVPAPGHPRLLYPGPHLHPRVPQGWAVGPPPWARLAGSSTAGSTADLPAAPLSPSPEAPGGGGAGTGVRGGVQRPWETLDGLLLGLPGHPPGGVPLSGAGRGDRDVDFRTTWTRVRAAGRHTGGPGPWRAGLSPTSLRGGQSVRPESL